MLDYWFCSEVTDFTDDFCKKITKKYIYNLHI